MIRDRGRMKWVSMMLPEHVQVLREWAQEDSYVTKKELDEQQVEMINGIIVEAIELDRAVNIIHYRDHQYEQLVGYVCDRDDLNSRLHVVDCFGEKHQIEWQNVMDVQWADDKHP